MLCFIAVVDEGCRSATFRKNRKCVKILYDHGKLKKNICLSSCKLETKIFSTYENKIRPYRVNITSQFKNFSHIFFFVEKPFPNQKNSFSSSVYLKNTYINQIH